METEFRSWEKVLEYLNTLEPHQVKRLLINTRYDRENKELFWIVTL